MNGGAVLIPFGPGEHELERVRDLLDSIFTHQPDVRWVVLVDDDPADKNLLGTRPCPKGCTIVRLVNPHAGKRRPKQRATRGPLCVKTLLGLAWLEANTDAPFVARLDTDALVIAPYAQRLQAYFSRHPHVAAVSCYKYDCNGRLRNGIKNPWPSILRQMTRPVRVNRTLPFVHLALWGARAKVRHHIADAVARGYVLGESCFGGAMAVSGEFLRRLKQHGYFDDPVMWFDSRMSDDVLLSMYVFAVGMQLADMGEGEVFGVVYPGLPDTPERLLERGFAIIHAVKGDARFTEEEVGAYFRNHREALMMV